MKAITITISGNKVEEIIKYAYYKKLTGNWFPAGDMVDWLALQVIRAANQQAGESDPSTAKEVIWKIK